MYQFKVHLVASILAYTMGLPTFNNFLHSLMVFVLMASTNPLANNPSHFSDIPPGYH